MHMLRIAWEQATGGRTSDGIFGFDHEADVKSARLASRLDCGLDLDEHSAARLGIALHYVYGPAVGILCGMVDADYCSPLALGTILWIAADEVPISAARISNPLKKSVFSHTGALLAHWLYAAVLLKVTKSKWTN